MKTSLLWLFSLLVIIASCNSDSDDLILTDDTFLFLNLPDVVLLSEDENSDLIETQITANTESIERVNLTQTLGVSDEYTFLKYRDPVLAFFEREINNYEVYEKNVQTGEAFVTLAICEPSGQVHRAADRSEDKLILLTNDPITNENFVRIMDRETGACSELALGAGTLFSQQRVSAVIGETLFAYLGLSDGTFRLFRIDLATATIENQLDLENFPTITLIDDLVYVWAADGAFSRYDNVTFNMTGEGLLSPDLSFVGLGLLQPENEGTKVVFNIILGQPSLFGSSPAIVDLSTAQVVKGSPDLLPNFNQILGNFLETDVLITQYDADVTTESIVYAYMDLATGLPGLAYSNFESDILRIVPLEEEPTFILIR